MKIVIAGPAWPYRGGIAAFNERLAREFIAAGHDVEIVTFRLQYPSLFFPGKTQYSEGAAPEGITIRRVINSINPINWIVAGIRLRRKEPDLLILRYWLPFMAPSLGTIARIVAGNGHTKVIALFDNVIPHEKRPGDNFLTSFFTRSVHAGVTMAESVFNDLRRFRPGIPAVVSPHPVFDHFGEDPGRVNSLIKLGLNIHKKYILFFGFVRAYKGLDLLLEAFSVTSVRDRGEVKLIVAGEFYDDEKRYREIIAERGLSEDVFIYDHFISDDEVRYYFGAADLVVQPYRSATQSGVTQIAYHFGKPMIVTNVGGLAEMVPDGRCGFVTEPDAESIASAIDRFFSEDHSEIFAAGIEEQKKKYGWNRLAGAITDLLVSL